MPYNLLLLPLLGGYILVHLCHYLRFRAQRLDGYRLLIESAIAGVVLVILSRGVVVALRHTPVGAFAMAVAPAFAPFPYVGTAIGSFLIGGVLPIFINFLC